MPKGFEHNYHSHTFRCGHASGSDEEYVLAAIEAGFKTIGFSDHVMLPYNSQPGIRGDYIELEGYASNVSFLKAKYKGKIDILLGFEAEWLGKNMGVYYEKLLSEKGFDYLILGQHCRLEKGMLHWYRGEDKKESLKNYAKDITEGMKSGLFAYVAHPDHFMIWYGDWDEECEKAAHKICQVAKEMDLPLEVNMNPSRGGRRNEKGKPVVQIYPYPDFWDIVKEEGCKVILGVDAHNPKDYARQDYEWAFSFCEDHGLKPIGKLNLPKEGISELFGVFLGKTE